MFVIPTDPRLLGRTLRILAAAVLERGGRVSVNKLFFRALMIRNHRVVEQTRHSIVFALTPSDEIERDSSMYPDKHLFYADVMFKHLISTSPKERLTVTTEAIYNTRGMFLAIKYIGREGIVVEVSREAVFDKNSQNILSDGSITHFELGPRPKLLN